MFEWIKNLFAWLTSFWTDLSDEDKEKIIDIIVGCFVSIFKAYYHTSKSEGDTQND